MGMKLTEHYIKPDQLLWSGRKTDPSLGDLYWFQAIDKLDLEAASHITPEIAIIGYQVDEGVRRNQGRVGAAEGPVVIRQRLAKLAFHHTGKAIADVGSVQCLNGDLETCQDEFSKIITQLQDNNVFTLGLGGGHDIAYAHFRGMYNSILKKSGSSSIGIINFDAHFDLRPKDKSANSGTPFYQILNELSQEKVEVSYLPIGIQQQSNTKDLFEIAEAHRTNWIGLDDCLFQLEAVSEKVKAFVNQHDYIYITIDLDGFSSAYAPGVSASNPIGLTPPLVKALLHDACSARNIIGLDLAEMNPTYDKDETTAKLAAGLVDFIVGIC